MLKTETDLKQALNNEDTAAIQCFVVDQQNLLLNDWLNGSHDDFRQTLQRSLQRSHRIKRSTAFQNNEISYQMGVWEGVLQTYNALYDEERREEDLMALAVAKSQNTEKIIRFLYQHGEPICHGDLADRLGMNYSTLTNAMKRVIACGAVTACRTGRNTRYTLTQAAKQFCKKEQKWTKVISKDRKEALMEELVCLLRAQTPSARGDLSVHAGDSVRIRDENNEAWSERKKLTWIMQAGKEKYLRLEPDNDSGARIQDPYGYKYINMAIQNSR